MFRTLVRVCAGLAIGLLGLAPPASADTITFDFTSAVQGGAFGAGSSGNTRTYTSGGITVTVTGWGYTFGTTDSALQAAALGSGARVSACATTRRLARIRSTRWTTSGPMTGCCSCSARR